MSLFQNSVLNKYLKLQDKQKITAQWSEYKNYFHDPHIQANIRDSKEEEFQEGFVRELFVRILGYVLKPQSNYNFVLEQKNVKDSKKADGAILINGKVKAVIELKGTDTIDLGKIETQAFGYKNNQPDCTYVVTSNFEKLRFYIDNAVDYLEYNLFTLTENDFREMYLCLAHENLSNGLAKKIKEESVSQEDVITKKLYKDYSNFKTDLYQNLVQLNPQYDPLLLFKKSQKLLDRFLFVFFAEDRNLLPTNLIFRINKEWRQLQEMRIDVSLYQRYKMYFRDLDTGAKVTLPAFNQTASLEKEVHQIFAYNGGLFKDDDVLNDIAIDDELLFAHTQTLSNYDFDSEIDVNILGHIFENSLNEIDAVKAQLEGAVIDKTKTKRKKDGVFYTPKYITKYIVDNTIGKLCAEKKAELIITDENYQPGKRSRKRLDNLQQYRQWLLQLTICDPACGSGAFLNQALEFLIAEHRYIDELSATYNKDTFVLSDVEAAILENNLFGVDLNEESVEIAKLSLWLRTAQPHRKLNDLSSNIKCGNSLIDDPEVAGDKAFSWAEEFPQVFARGGFDVVIGNPPYVGTKQIPVNDRGFYWLEYAELLFSEMDLYEIFLYKSAKQLLKANGYLGFITPNSYYTNISFKNLREFLFTQTKVETIIDFPYRFYPFDEVNTETAIIILKNEYDKKNFIHLKSINKNKQQILNGMENVYNNEIEVSQSSIVSKFNNIVIISLTPLLIKLASCKKRFGDYLELHKGWMSIPQQVVFENITYDGIYTNVELKESKYLEENSALYLEGRDIHRYYKDNVEKYVFIKGMDKKTTTWHLKPKIILQRIVGQNKNKIFATVDFENHIIFPNANLANLKNPKDDVRFYLSILNSRLISFYYNQYFGESNTNLTKLAFESLPLPEISKVNHDLYIDMANIILVSNVEIKERSQKFQRSLQRKFSLEDLPKKLQDWYLLSYGDFIKELGKKKIKLTLAQEAEWEDYFEQEKKKALELKAKIDATDKEIDQMVYALYGLTAEEIAIVEKG